MLVAAIYSMMSCHLVKMAICSVLVTGAVILMTLAIHLALFSREVAQLAQHPAKVWLSAHCCSLLLPHHHSHCLCKPALHTLITTLHCPQLCPQLPDVLHTTAAPTTATEPAPQPCDDKLCHQLTACVCMCICT